MKIKIKLYDEIHNIDVRDDDAVLDAVLEAGLEPDYSCQVGACGSCKAKLVDGKVEMEEHDALTDEEISEGFVLTCQAKPLTDDVFIDYDID